MEIRVKERRNIIFSLLFVAVAMMVLAACGGDDKKEESPLNPVTPTGQTYKQSVTLDVLGTQQTVTLTDLKSKIDDVANSADWLTVLISTYSSGSPSLVVSAKENTDTKTRSCTVNVTAKSGDTVLLTVTQEAAEEQKTGIDDSHDIPTDKPAYSRIAK